MKDKNRDGEKRVHDLKKLMIIFLVAIIVVTGLFSPRIYALNHKAKVMFGAFYVIMCAIIFGFCYWQYRNAKKAIDS